MDVAWGTFVTGGLSAGFTAGIITFVNWWSQRALRRLAKEKESGCKCLNCEKFDRCKGKND